MKRYCLAAIALTVLGSPASTGSAVAQNRYGSPNAPYSGYYSDSGIIDEAPERSSAASAWRKTYAWPDQRYYGAHGMVSD